MLTVNAFSRTRAKAAGERYRSANATGHSSVKAFVVLAVTVTSVSLATASVHLEPETASSAKDLADGALFRQP